MRRGFLCSAIILLWLITGNISMAQVPRVSERNTIVWTQVNMDLRTSRKWGVHLDLNYRRADFLSIQMQSLVRAGINFRPSEKLLFRVGGVLAFNSIYGEYPGNAAAKPFNERRLIEMIQIADKIGVLELNHRFVLEQRWIERFSKADLEEPDDIAYINRMRYLIRMQLPLKKSTKQLAYPYLMGYDEIFVSFGNEVNANIFDQNRLALLLGYRFNSTVRVEAGYLNQIFQLGRRVNNNNVVQHNNGLQVNLLLNLTTKKEIN